MYSGSAQNVGVFALRVFGSQDVLRGVDDLAETVADVIGGCSVSMESACNGENNSNNIDKCLGNE
jgi:hypothetical protein